MSGFHLTFLSSDNAIWSTTNDSAEESTVPMSRCDHADWLGTVAHDDAREEAAWSHIEKAEAEQEEKDLRELFHSFPKYDRTTLPEPARTYHYDSIFGRAKLNGKDRHEAIGFIQDIGTTTNDIVLAALAALAALAQQRQHPIAVLEALQRDMKTAVLTKLQALEDAARDPVTGEWLNGINTANGSLTTAWAVAQLDQIRNGKPAQVAHPSFAAPTPFVPVASVPAVHYGLPVPPGLTVDRPEAPNATRHTLLVNLKLPPADLLAIAKRQRPVTAPTLSRRALVVNSKVAPNKLRALQVPRRPVMEPIDDFVPLDTTLKGLKRSAQSLQAARMLRKTLRVGVKRARRRGY